MANIIQTIVRPLQQLTSFVKNLPSAIGQRIQYGVLAMSSYVREIWPDINARSSIEQGYADNTAVFSIVTFDSEKFASIPRYLYNAKVMDKDTYTERITEGSQYDDLLNLLQNPNSEMTQSEFYELVRIYYLCCGEAIVWLNRGDVAEKYIPASVATDGSYIQEQFVQRTPEEIKQMPVLEMWVLPPGWVGVIPDPTNLFAPLGYWLDKGGTKYPISKDDVIHWKRPNPVYDPINLGHLRGLAPLKVGRRTLQENVDATASMDRMFKNDGSKGVLVNENIRWDQLDEEQKQDLIDTIDSRINNNDVKGAVATLGGKWSYLDIAKRSIDETLLEGKKFTWQELCFLFKTPYELFDGKTQYNNKIEAQKGWVSNTIWPNCKRLDEKMTKALAISFNLKGKVVICSEVSALPEMQKDIAALITAFSNAWYLPTNAKLVALGYEPNKNALFNEPWVPDGVRPLSEVEKENTFVNQDRQQNLNTQNEDSANQNQPGSRGKY